MKPWTIALLALPAVVVGGVVLADGGSGVGNGAPSLFRTEAGMRGFRHPELSAQDREAFADARIAALKAGLKLTPDQDKLWPPVEDAIRALAQQRREARQARRERFAAMRDDTARDIPAQLRFMADRQAASAAALAKLADASAPLYAALNDAQKRRLTVLGRFMRTGGGMGWRERRAERWSEGKGSGRGEWQ